MSNTNHRSGLARRALALHVGPALLMLATVLPTALLLDRLPRYLAPPFEHARSGYLVAAAASSLCIAAGWVCVAGVDRLVDPPHRRMLWELAVPLLYGLGGLIVVLGVRGLAHDVGRQYAPPPPPPGPADFPMLAAAILASAGVGLLLGRRAAATEPAPGPGARAVWVAEVHADRSWWLLQGICALAACVVVAGPYVLAGSWVAALQADAGLVIVLAAVDAWASRGHVSISPWGIKARYGHVPLLGWELPMDQITAVEVGRVRLLRSWAAWRCLSNLALRDGPALVVRTRGGRRRVVTVPVAEDAAAVLGAWRRATA